MAHCKDCKYWQYDFEDSGFCHRYPPDPINSALSRYATTRSISWCGEFASRDAQTTADLSPSEGEPAPVKRGRGRPRKVQL